MRPKKLFRTITSVNFDIEIREKLEELSEDEGISLSEFLNRLFRKSLTDGSYIVAKEKLSAPIIDTTLPEFRDQVYGYSDVEGKIEALFAYLNETSLPDDKLYSQFAFLVAIGIFQKKHKNESGTFFENGNVDRLSKCSHLTKPTIRALIREQSAEIVKAVGNVRALPEPTEPYDLKPLTFETVSQWIEWTQIYANNTVIAAPLECLGDNCRIFVAVNTDDAPILFRMIFELTEEEDARQHCQQFIAQCCDLETITNLEWCKTFDEFYDNLKSEQLDGCLVYFQQS